MKFELEPYHRNVTKDEMLKDLKSVASRLQKNSVTIEEYNRYGKFHACTLKRKFGSWFIVLKNARLEKTRNYGLTEKELLEDLICVARNLKKDSITRFEYENHGKFSCDTYARVFGSWFKALDKAGLKKTRNLGITEEEYFKNLEEVWVKLGRQPYYNDMQKPLSRYSASAYADRFDTWRRALEKFVDYINQEKIPQTATNIEVEPVDSTTSYEQKHKTKRNISWRLRFVVMRRDNFKCKHCGRTPATDAEIILHVDHITPYANGGETVLDNLQTLCSVCNIGKSNLVEKL